MWLLLERIWRRHPLRLLIRAIATAALSVTVLRLVPGQPTGLTARLKRIETMQNPRACMPANIAAQHVLAAAVRGDAEVLVTFNPGDFPDTATSVHAQ